MGSELKYAFVSGASSGIGKEIALLLANKYNYNLIVCARRVERLVELAEMVKTEVVVIGCDLTDENDRKNLFQQLEKYDIEIAINNAGVGSAGQYVQSSKEENKNMILLNVVAFEEIFYYFLRYFKEKGKGYLLTTGSSAGFCNGPYMGLYYASKNFVRALVLSTQYEMGKEKDILISLLAPGPVETEFAGRANVDFKGIIVDKKMDGKYVAEYALKKLFKRKKIIVPGKRFKLFLFLQKIVPANWAMHQIAKHQQRKIKNKNK